MLASAAVVTSIASLTNHQCYPTNITKLPDSTRVCDERGTTFCSLRYKIATPFAEDVHSTFSLYGCFDLGSCDSKRSFDELMSYFCEIPSCSIFEDESDRLLCTTSQVLLCELGDRFRVDEHTNTSIVCVTDDDQSASVLDAGLQRDVLSISGNDMDALVHCGAGYFRDLPSLLYSGAATSLGDYPECMRHHNNAEDKYCTAAFDTLVYQGHCLPQGTCSGPLFANLLDFICSGVGVREDASYHGLETCLDLVDTVPLPLCVVTQLLGCSSTVTSLNQSMDFLALLTHPRDLRQAKRKLAGVQYDWVSHIPAAHSHEVYDNLVSLLGQRLGGESVKNLLSRNATTITMPVSASDDANATLPEEQDVLTDVLNYTWSQIGKSLSWAKDSVPSSGAWFPSEDTIKKYRFEARDADKRYEVRCGGWTAPLDDSLFNKTVGVLIASLLISIPLVTAKRYTPKGWFNVLRGNFDYAWVRGKQLSEGAFGHVCGLRTFSMFWIILGHTFTFAWQRGVDTYLSRTFGIIHDYKFQVIISGQLAVDTFFFLSGLMYGLFGSKKLEEVYNRTDAHKKKMSLAKAMAMNSIRRYLRLMPTVAFVLAFTYWCLPYTANGPMWVPFVDYMRYGMTKDRSGGCYTTWWRVLTMTNNLTEGADGLNCLGHVWYLSNDYQFYLTGNILLFASIVTGSRKLLYWSIFGIIMVASFYSYHVVVTRSLHFSIPAFSDPSLTPSEETGTMDMMQNWANFYVKPWCRVGPYLIGLAAGVCYRDGWFERQIMVTRTRPQPPRQHKGLKLIRKVSSADTPDTLRRTYQAAEHSAEEPHRSREEPESVTTYHIDYPLVFVYVALTLVGLWVTTMSIPYLANKGNTMSWNVTLDRLWFVYNRSLWALLLALLTLSLAYVDVPAQDDKPTINAPVLVFLKRFLSTETLGVISVYTFGFYLVHPPLQQAYYAARTFDVVIENSIGWFATLGHYVVTMFYGVILTVTIEYPLARIFTALGL